MAEPTIRSVIEDAATAWDELQKMYDGQDKEKRERGGFSSRHRDAFESFIDCLVEDAKAVLAKFAE